MCCSGSLLSPRGGGLARGSRAGAVRSRCGWVRSLPLLAWLALVQQKHFKQSFPAWYKLRRTRCVGGKTDAWRVWRRDSKKALDHLKQREPEKAMELVKAIAAGFAGEAAIIERDRVEERDFDFRQWCVDKSHVSGTPDLHRYSRGTATWPDFMHPEGPEGGDVKYIRMRIQIYLNAHKVYLNTIK